MKKSLVALAALAVVGAASAQSTVTMYGLVDMGVNAQRDTNTILPTAPAGVATEFNRNSMKSILADSRIGFKGTEDLGGGLNANFLMELALITNDSVSFATTGYNRQSYVGLNGGFGEVRLGRQYTPYHTVQAAMDLYGNIAAPGYVVGLHNRARASNAVTYFTPNFGGFAGSVQIAAGELAVAPGILATGNSYGLSGVYAKGPLVAGLAYDSVTNPNGTFTALSAITGGALFALNGTPATSASTTSMQLFGGTNSNEVKVWAAGASYDFTVVKASLAYSSLTDNQKIGSDIGSKGWNLSVAAPFGAVKVIGNLGRANVTSTGANDITYTGYQLGVNYSFSKRTTAYAVLGNDDVTASAAGFGGDITRRQASVGVMHTF